MILLNDTGSKTEYFSCVTEVLVSGVFKGVKNMPRYTMMIQENPKGMVYVFATSYYLCLRHGSRI